MYKIKGKGVFTHSSQRGQKQEGDPTELHVGWATGESVRASRGGRNLSICLVQWGLTNWPEATQQVNGSAETQTQAP